MRPFVRLGLAVLAVLILIPGVSVPRARSADIDYDLPGGGGHFYGQADGQGGASGNGYVVDNSNGIMFWDYLKAVGGPTIVGFPVSDRMQWNGFVVQAFQKVVFQWRPELGTVYNVNVFDEMHDRGMDGFLESARSVPQPSDTAPDTGLTWEQVVARHNLFMNSDDDIRAAYFAESDPINLNGLPVAPIKQIGEVLVLRAQRKVFQKWLTDTSFARKGQVIVANGGDVAKEAGLFPTTSIVPKGPNDPRPLQVVPPPGPPPTPVPSVTSTPAASPTPSGPVYPYLQKGSTTWEPNCGLTQIKGYVFNADGSPQSGTTVKVWTGGWDGAISFPTRSDGYWDVLLDAAHAKPGSWNIAVIRGGQLVSPVVVADTNTTDCAPGGGGHQVVRVDFIVNGGNQPSPPASPPPPPASTPIPTATQASGGAPTGRVVNPPTGQYQPASIQADPNARWQVALLHQLTPCENRSLGLVFVESYDLNGQPVNIKLKSSTIGTVSTGEKGPGKTELYNYRGNMELYVDDGSPSDHAVNMDTVLFIPPPGVYCNGDESLGGNVTNHISYQVVFRQVRP